MSLISRAAWAFASVVRKNRDKRQTALIPDYSRTAWSIS
ncbi:hypothetical protein RISK_005211 [Rhodopirellula islandica]|uniref:Uncharacterized protein n=1 Tax=Rhodopirellula islandica TaxID=595434 RepID=A0A0J1B7Y5_RHOIS|nr:hypothetical protein RISK_005211 [Rhodopirellula islandica]